MSSVPPHERFRATITSKPNRPARPTPGSLLGDPAKRLPIDPAPNRFPRLALDNDPAPRRETPLECRLRKSFSPIPAERSIAGSGPVTIPAWFQPAHRSQNRAAHGPLRSVAGPALSCLTLTPSPPQPCWNRPIADECDGIDSDRPGA